MPKGIHTVDLDSRRQTGRDSEIAPTEYEKTNVSRFGDRSYRI
jgi:hypothetical protein